MAAAGYTHQDNLPAYLDSEALALWLIWGQTDSDREAIAEYFAECQAVQAKVAQARRIDETQTRDETPAPNTARALFPVWVAEAPMELAIVEACK